MPYLFLAPVGQQGREKWLPTRASAFLTVSVTYLLPGVVLDVKGEEARGVFAQHVNLIARLLQLVPAQV